MFKLYNKGSGAKFPATKAVLLNSLHIGPTYCYFNQYIVPTFSVSIANVFWLSLGPLLDYTDGIQTMLLHTHVPRYAFESRGKNTPVHRHAVTFIYFYLITSIYATKGQ